MLSQPHRFFAGKQLVVFGAGYVGGELARQGLERGMRVTALTRNPLRADQLRRNGLEVIEGDLVSRDWHDQMPARVDFVLNSVSSGGSGVEGYQHSYVDGMRSLHAWAQSRDIGTLVYTGSTSVYPQGDGALVDESSLISGDIERVARLIETESLVRETPGVARWFILRLAGIYGPSRHHVLNQLRSGRALPGSGGHCLNLIHRDDICRAIWAVFGSPDEVRDQVFNVSDGSPVTKRTLVQWLATRLRLPEPQFDPSLPSVRRRSIPDRVIVNRKLKIALGWQPEFPDYRAGYESILKTL